LKPKLTIFNNKKKKKKKKKKKGFFNILHYVLIKTGSILVVNPCASIHKVPGMIPPYDHFPGFPHKRFLLNMVIRVTSMSPIYILLLKKDTELTERVTLVIYIEEEVT